MINKGNWKYKKSNQTIVFKQNQYEIDLERGNQFQWFNQCSGKSFISDHDLSDLESLFLSIQLEEPELEVFTSKVPRYLENREGLSFGTYQNFNERNLSYWKKVTANTKTPPFFNDKESDQK